MPNFTISERYLHPEGTFPAQLKDWEEKPGKFGPQIKWTFTTNVQKDDETPAELSFYTSQSFSTDPRNKLMQLFTVFGLPMPVTAEEAAAFNPEFLIGKTCRVRVVHRAGSDGTDWANIDQLIPVTKKPALVGTVLPPPQPGDDSLDPFADS